MHANQHMDLSKKAWRDFIEIQPSKYPEYFKIPFSEPAMAYFKKILECICERAILQKSISGFYIFIQAVQSEQARNLMLTWLDTYSPIRQIKTKDGSRQHEVIRDFIPLCSMIDARINPYYKIKAKPTKIHKIKKYLPLEIITKVNDQQPFETGRAAKSDLELVVKLAKIAFNNFIRDRSIDSKKKLLDRINSIPTDEIQKRGQPFLQGGAPGLGKN